MTRLERDGETSVTWGARSSVRDGLSDLYQTLAASSRRGELGPGVFAAAEQELDQAAMYLADRGQAGRRALVAVLRQLGGTLAGRGDVAAKIAALIDLAEEPG
jgi:hypothetical protein